MTKLFQTFALRGITLKNRFMISPMCTYRAGQDGMAHDWHLMHYGRLAAGGAAIVMTESISVVPDGRHCYGDIGIWNDEQIVPLKRITDFIKAQDSIPAIQLQHAGRKASSTRPWHGGARALDETDLKLRGEKGWTVVAPSPLPYTPSAPTPRELTTAEVRELVTQYAAAAERALRAGFEIIEVHAAHGYLINEFLSPVANHRTDEYGGSLQNRMRFLLEIIDVVRAIWPEDRPVLVRVSAVDGVEGGWSLDDTVALAQELKLRGVDAIDCSSGGMGGSAVNARVSRGPGFQVPFAERVRLDAGIATVAVGLILEPAQAAEIVDSGRADIVAIGREALRDPNWPNVARTQLDPAGGYAHWPDPVGWWLDRRAQSLAAKD
ncbi:NADH:flavin oxidoreductase/NADH oxidase [Variovorax sp. E3]|uniref:NADH:flavin oxidoreductase/NADH oxidase n=1 Tax=Variovorax sp. E3 TaxID=1914993 RepID=UPI0018DC7768|nr:NADH:flavin oxidoreductase/NADH oxidase [Variovorax sp. E3]